MRAKTLPVALVELVGMALYLLWLQHILVTYLLHNSAESWIVRAQAVYQTHKLQKELDKFEVWQRSESSVEPNV